MTKNHLDLIQLHAQTQRKYVNDIKFKCLMAAEKIRERQDICISGIAFNLILHSNTIYCLQRSTAVFSHGQHEMSSSPLSWLLRLQYASGLHT